MKRIAFVIGSSDYAQLSSLPNARRDAAVMANALADIGFDVVEIAENLSRAELRAVPAIVAERAAQADVVLVFYAGHGVETGGVNYLIPVDADPDGDGDLRDAALALPMLATAASRARRGALVVIDACRDDPFAEARAAALSRGGGAAAAMPRRLHMGLAATPAVAPNNIVFHSTQPGQAALDGEGLDSPFVRALLETLSTPGKPLDAVVKETTARVAARTDGRQVPAAYGAAPAVPLLPLKVAQ